MSDDKNANAVRRFFEDDRVGKGLKTIATSPLTYRRSDFWIRGNKIHDPFKLAQKPQGDSIAASHPVKKQGAFEVVFGLGMNAGTH
jgi:hypothetical protein